MADLKSVDSRLGRRATDGRPVWASTAAVLRVVFTVLAVAFALWLLYELRSLILLLVLSIFFAYLLAPLVQLASSPITLGNRQRNLSRAPAIGLVYLLLIILLATSFAWLIPRISAQASQLMGQAPDYLKALNERSESLSAVLDRLGLPPDAKNAVRAAFATLAGDTQAAGQRVLSSLVELITYLPWLILIPILAFFLLKDAKSFERGAIRLLPAGRLRANGVELFERINEALAAYIRAQLLACLLIGIVVAIGFALLGVPYAMTLGVLAGLAEFVPLVGPFVVAVVAGLLAAFHYPILALWVLIFLAVLRVLEDYVVYPRLVGHGIDLHPLAIILAVLAGAELAGVAGVFLSVPALAVISATWRQYQVFSSAAPAEEVVPLKEPRL